MIYKKIVISGGFAPLQIGHLRMIKKAAEMKGPKGTLIVILNNDNWLREKRTKAGLVDKEGKPYIWQDQYARREILEEIKGVDIVLFTNHTEGCSDISICDSLLQTQPDIFANGGDRKAGNIPEYNLCEDKGIKMIFNVGGGKIANSSDFIKQEVKNV